MTPFELIDRAMFLASGQDDPHSETIAELCNHLERAVRLYAAAYDAVEFAHSEGFEWPVDPFSGLAVTFANVGAADERLAVEYRASEAAACNRSADLDGEPPDAPAIKSGTEPMARKRQFCPYHLPFRKNGERCPNCNCVQGPPMVQMQRRLGKPPSNGARPSAAREEDAPHP